MRPLKLLLAASIVLPTAVAGAMGFWSYHQTLNESESHLKQTAFILREHALRVFEAQENAIELIDGRISGMSWEDIEGSARVHDLLRSVRNHSPHIGGIWLVRPDGRTANSADFFPVPFADTTEREYYKVLKARDVTHLGEMIRGYLKGNLSFNLSRRRSATDGSFNGLILVTISLNYFEAFWHDILGEEANVASILRADGNILARYPGVEHLPKKIWSDSPFFSLITDHDSATYTYSSAADGRERTYSFAKLGDFPAYMVVGVDRDAILEPWWRQLAIMGTIAAAITILLTLATQSAFRRQMLLRKEITRRREAETNLIAKEEHLAALENAEAELRGSEERFRSLFETLTEGVLYFDAEGRIVSGNAASEEILGLPLSGMKGRHHDDPRWQMVDAEGKPCPPGRQPAALALRTGTVLRGERRGVHNPTRGERRWLKITSIPQRRAGESRPSGVFSVFSDVTDQLRSERAQDLLIREVDHRAKNALAVVQAILRLTKAPTIEAFTKAVEGRVAAMGRAHTLLTRSRWEGADLRTLIEEELAPYRPAEGGHVRVEGAPLFLHTDATQAVGMVIHELATNAAKYGALSSSEGVLTVGWHVDEEDGSLDLRWVEEAKRTIEPPTGQGFGSTLICSTVEGQLGGQIEMEWAPEGLRTSIRIPPRHLARQAMAVASSSSQDKAVGAATLAGARVLLAEDNASVALELVQTLEGLGCTVVGPVAALDAAARLVLVEPVDLAVLDVDLQGRKVFPVADLLASFGVPVVFCTGFGDIDPLAHGPKGNVHLVRKPFSRSELAQVLSAALAASANAEPALN